MTLPNASVFQRPPCTRRVVLFKKRHNEDGSYSYGYEAADGSYKIESKYPTGEVYGKYGFVDDTGNVREIEYGASRRGFEPAGPGINVPPPTLTGNSIANPNQPEDDGQYREDPSVYYTDPRYTNGERYDPVPRQPLAQNQPRPIPAPIYNPPRIKEDNRVHTVVPRCCNSLVLGRKFEVTGHYTGPMCHNI
ncbi:hypothetical protein WN51_12732 [Melipona quadrifasciata]|uniref:Cuticle protein 6 n=1 Tax=Melipona quadrifasciata TaxID=166423 RepID=A0A0M9A148_9HYME|nr:hypothetical protein WN51_12732 [Melipona quadrifasciata]